MCFGLLSKSFKKANFHTSFTARKSAPNETLYKSIKSAQYKTPSFISCPNIQAALKIAKKNTSRGFYFGLYGIWNNWSWLFSFVLIHKCWFKAKKWLNFELEILRPFLEVKNITFVLNSVCDFECNLWANISADENSALYALPWVGGYKCTI